MLVTASTPPQVNTQMLAPLIGDPHPHPKKNSLKSNSKKSLLPLFPGGQSDDARPASRRPPHKKELANSLEKITRPFTRKKNSPIHQKKEFAHSPEKRTRPFEGLPHLIKKIPCPPPLFPCGQSDHARPASRRPPLLKRIRPYRTSHRPPSSFKNQRLPRPPQLFSGRQSDARPAFRRHIPLAGGSGARAPATPRPVYRWPSSVVVVYISSVGVVVE